MTDVDLDLFNKEQRPFNYDYDCLEFGRYLWDTWCLDTSDQEYEAWRERKAYEEEQMELAEDAYREKLELQFN